MSFDFFLMSHGSIAGITGRVGKTKSKGILAFDSYFLSNPAHQLLVIHTIIVREERNVLEEN
jgi:hypothetical protein